MTRARCRRCRVAWRAFHRHHGPKLSKVGKVGIFGEMGYHGSELIGMHSGVMAAAAVLVVIYLARVLAGEL